MKSRIINICAALFMAVIPFSLFAQEPAMYVYKIDGTVNGFLMSQVDSLSYSKIGLDSVEYDIPVVQQIWTKDGLYQVAISDVDSIGYYTPEPVLKSGLFIIDENNVGQIADVDFKTMTISFLGNTPEGELPQDGQVIFCDLEDEPFPMGFSGRVTKVRNEGGKHIYECEVAEPEDVYDRLLLVGHVGSEGHQSNLPGKRPLKKGHYDGNYNISTSLFDYLSVSGKGSVVLDYTLNVNAFNSEPATFWMKKQHDLTLDFKLSTKDEDMKDALPTETGEKVKETWATPFRLCTIAGILNIDLRLGCFFEYGNTFSIEASGLKYTHTDIDEYTWKSDNPLHIERTELVNEGGWNFNPLEDNLGDIFKLKAELEGSISFGACMEFDIDVWKPSFLALALGVKVGPELKGSFAVDTDFFRSESIETGMYKFFSEDLKMTFGVKVGLDLKAKYKKHDQWKIFKASRTFLQRTVTLLPKLSKPALPKIYEVAPNKYMLDTFDAWDDNLGWNSNDPMSIRTIAKNITLFPGPVGFAVYDEGGNQISEVYCDLEDWHWVNTSSFARSIRGISPQKIKVYPMYKIMGLIPVKAEPSTINIPQPLSLSTDYAVTKVGETVDVTCNDGWGYYSWDCTDDKVASLKMLEKNGVKYVQAEGVRPGNTTVTVTDVRSGDSKTFDLQVRSSGFDLSTYNLKMNPKDVRTVTVFPQDEYQLNNSKPSVATVKLLPNSNDNGRNSSVIQVTALKVGKCTVTVSQPQNEHSLTFDVEVTDDYVKPGYLDVEPATVNFGDVPTNNTRKQQFSISNTGEKELKFRINNTCEVFEFPDNYGVTTLEPGKSMTIEVEFTPTQIDYDYECDVTIQTDASNGNQTLKLLGHGVEPSHAHINVEPSVLDFGEVEVHSRKTMQFTVSNTGETRTYFTVSEPSSDVFIIPERDEDISLFPNREKTFNVIFKPEQVGEDYDCDIIISSDAENGNQTLKLKGKGKEYEDYVHGVCSGFTPEDGAVVDASSGYVRVSVEEVVLQHDGENVFAMSLSDDPTKLGFGKCQSVSTTWNGHKGEKRGSTWYDFQINPGTKYYWQVEYFDYEKENFVKCSSILTFTTIP